MCEKNGQFILYGVVGGGYECGTGVGWDYPAFYANVFQNMDFIKKAVGHVSYSVHSTNLDPPIKASTILNLKLFLAAGHSPAAALE